MKVRKTFQRKNVQNTVGLAETATLNSESRYKQINFSKMENVNLELNDVKELQFDSKAVKVEELEERKEMIVL